VETRIMPDDPLQIFMSYARADDELPEDALADARGFVTRLYNDLSYELVGAGKPATIWRDLRRIEKGDLFDHVIEEAIETSAIFLAVLSENWMRSAYCQKELALFAERWRHEGEKEIRERAVVVGKRHILRSRRPSLLQGQEGYRFYELSQPGEVSVQQEFYKAGRARDSRFAQQVEELGQFLCKRAHELRDRSRNGRRPESKPNGRTIYVAVPASDMRKAYNTVVTELQERGYTVVPNPSEYVFLDPGTIESAFDGAEASVHLLGEGHGPTPEGADQPIVQLQLLRAAAKVRAATSSGLDGTRTFRRFIWASRSFGDKSDRDPLEVLKKFQGCDEADAGHGWGPPNWVANDTVIGDVIDEFVSVVVRWAETPEQVAEPIPANSQIYVYHDDPDRQYAVRVAKALRECKVIPVLPPGDGDRTSRMKLHQDYLKEHDFVVLCWAGATDVWRKTAAHELKDWQQLGRTRRFSRRGLVVGPPPGPFKLELEVAPPPPSEIDVVLDLTEKDPPSAEALRRLLGTSAA
jgi:hypothetical protein